MHLIGLDIGTTSICGVLLKASSKEIVHSITKDNNAALRSPRAWEFTQDPAVIVAAVREIFAELRLSGVPVQGIGLTGQMHGIVYVDRHGEAVSPLYTWQDQRGDLVFEHGISYAEQMKRLTGYPLAAGYGLVTHRYNLIHDLVPKQAVSLCTIADFVAMKLSNGTKPCVDVTNAAGLGLYDLKTLDFDRAAIKTAGLDPAILPEQVPSGTVVGHTEDGIPVCCALGDNQASFLGAVRDIRNSVLLNIGTGSQISVYADDYVHAEEVDVRPYPGEGYLLVGASLSGGKSYALLERFFRDVCSIFAGHHEGSFYEMMNRLAQSEVDNGTELRVNTRFYGTRQAPDVRGVIENMGPSNFTPLHLVHGFLDGTIRELNEYYDRFPTHIKQRVQRLVASGNGVRRNPALVRKLELVFGLSLVLPEYREEAAWGAALCAGVGTGCFPNFIHL